MDIKMSEGLKKDMKLLVKLCVIQIVLGLLALFLGILYENGMIVTSMIVCVIPLVIGLFVAVYGMVKVSKMRKQYAIKGKNSNSDNS